MPIEIKNAVYTFRNVNSRSPIPPGPRPINNKIIQESGSIPVFILLENSSTETIIQE